MTVVLARVVKLESEMLVHLPGNAGVDAIANPGIKVSVIKDFVRDKAGKSPNFQRMFELHSIAVMNEIEGRCPPMKFKPVSIAEGNLSQREFERGFNRQPLFLAAQRPGHLVFEMGVERKNSQVFR